MKMNDEQVEKVLKESWSASPPEGMRERVLRRASAEALPARPGRIRVLKVACAALAIGIIVFGNISDSARQARMVRANGGQLPRIAGSASLLALRYRLQAEGFGELRRWPAIEREGESL